MELLGRYKNGNYFVTIYKDGTKIRQNDLDNLTPDTYESIDVKVTNACDRGCLFCHENSVPSGDSAKIQTMYDFVDNLHQFTELAIGGGNPLEYPNLETMLRRCKKKDIIPSMTVNQDHFMRDFAKINYLVDNELVYGLGISYTNPDEEFFRKVKKFPNAVIHTIAGIHTPVDFAELADKDLKILILGYKQVRRGANLYNQKGGLIESGIEDLREKLPVMIKKEMFKSISFDNLSLEQLKVKEIIPEQQWNTIYMGGDGEYTFFVDLVKENFAKNSCEPENRRYKIEGKTPQQMFDYLREMR